MLIYQPLKPLVLTGIRALSRSRKGVIRNQEPLHYFVLNTSKPRKKPLRKDPEFSSSASGQRLPAPLDMLLVRSSTKSFDLVTIVFKQQNGEHTLLCDMTFISYTTNLLLPTRDDSKNCFPPLKDTSNLSPRQNLKLSHYFSCHFVSQFLRNTTILCQFMHL